MTATLTESNSNYIANTLPENWERKKQTEYDEFDLMVDAYETGKKDGREEFANIIREKLQNNINKAAECSEYLLKTLQKSYKIKPSDLYLKYTSPTKLEALFVVPKKSFISDDFSEVYKFCREYKSSINDDTFHLSFIFMPSSRHINRELIVCDGFSLKYDKK